MQRTKPLALLFLFLIAVQCVVVAAEASEELRARLEALRTKEAQLVDKLIKIQDKLEELEQPIPEKDRILPLAVAEQPEPVLLTQDIP
ncbi:MAG: hypothetical protein Q8P67_10435 [archaeon]|nr:hypothetical protein [archaeon]